MRDNKSIQSEKKKQKKLFVRREEKILQMGSKERMEDHKPLKNLSFRVCSINNSKLFEAIKLKNVEWL